MRRGVSGRHGDSRHRAAVSIDDGAGNCAGAALPECRQRHENRERKDKKDVAKILRVVHRDSSCLVEVQQN